MCAVVTVDIRWAGAVAWLVRVPGGGMGGAAVHCRCHLANR